MSDDRTTDPYRPENADGANTPAPADGAPAYGAPAYGAPAYGAPAESSAPDAAPSGAPATPPYDATGDSASASGAPATPPYDATGDSASASGAPAYGAPAYGAPAYGAPAYDTAAYGQPAYAAPGYGYGAAPARTNPLSIASLVASLVGLFVIPVIGQIAGVITGHIALKQIKTTAERGRGMALAGLLIGYISLGLGILLFIGIAILIGVSAGSSGSRYGV